MRGKDGLSFADVLILLALVLLVIALAIPVFRRNPELSEAEIVGDVAVTNAASTNLPAPMR